ncbi:MAG: hypothetical protein F6K11_21500 [Leptolyngbya sp. SIO3F4]|nr:hypothetical protein [Leptolyngbya sp. SIO3F4]
MLLFVSKRKITECLNLSGSTLKNYRLNGEWIEGLHWVRLNSRCIRYNLELIQDWLHNRHNPKAHMRAIKIYQEQLLSSPKKRSKKKQS